MTKILEIIAVLFKKTAYLGAGTASMWTVYQPEEPKELK